MSLKDKSKISSGGFIDSRIPAKNKKSDKIRLMHIINCFTFAGAEILVYNIAERIDKTRFDVFICSIGTNDCVVESNIKKMLQNKSITVLELEKPSQKNRIGGILRLAGLLRQYRIDVINTHCSSPDFYGKIAGFLVGVPFIYSTVHGKVGYKRTREIFLRHLTTNYIAISEYIKNYMREDLGVPFDKIEIIRNGVESADYHSIDRQAAKKAIMTELGIDINKRVVASIGRLVQLKGHNYLIDAARDILNKYDDVHFLIVGNDKIDIEWANGLKRLVKDKKLEKYFTFTGTRNDINNILAGTDVFVLPSLTEGLPLTVLEAMASGVPVVSTDVGSVSEVVKHRENGLLIPPGNSQPIAQSVIELLDNWEWAGNMAENARKLVRSKYSIEETAKGYEDLYLRNYYRN